MTEDFSSETTVVTGPCITFPRKELSTQNPEKSTNPDTQQEISSSNDKEIKTFSDKQGEIRAFFY